MPEHLQKMPLPAVAILGRDEARKAAIVQFLAAFVQQVAGGEIDLGDQAEFGE